MSPGHGALRTAHVPARGAIGYNRGRSGTARHPAAVPAPTPGR